MGKGDVSPLPSWNPIPLHPSPFPCFPGPEGWALTRLWPQTPCGLREVRTQVPLPSQHSAH